MPRISTLNSVYPTDCETLLQLRAECAGYSYFLNSGYINYYINDNFKPYEHRLMAELVYGEIPTRHQVHHINGIRSDNRSANLELLSPSAHAQYHHGVAIVSIAPCAACGKAVEVRQNRLERNEQFYCNRSCYRAATSKEPDPQSLQNLLYAVRNLSEIGRMFDVSHTTIRKWVKKHGLNTDTCNGRKYQVARASIDLAPAP